MSTVRSMRSTVTTQRVAAPPKRVPRRKTGTVEWFNLSRGVGLIKLPDGRQARVDFRDVHKRGFRDLHAGDTVSFVLERVSPEYGVTLKAAAVRLAGD